jgi:tRNA A-37 threonylcarbamoyl transferase component Bud32
LTAFNAIHTIGVVHGDVRADNILVADKGNAVWIIDFEFAEVVGVEDACLTQEMEEVKRLLRTIKTGHDSY